MTALLEKGTTTGAILHCTDVQKSFRTRSGRQITVLQGVNLAVQPGEVVVIHGRSGAGKSVLLGLLGGLDRPTAGTICCEGIDFSTLSNEALSRLRAEKIGIIFQNFNLLSQWTAFENVEAALLHTGMGPSERQAKVTAMLAGFGLKERLENLPAELSIGQQQRVAIARTLVRSPRLLLADEPTGDVDPETAQEILDCLLATVRDSGVTLVVTTHGNFPLEVADRTLRLMDGTLRESSAG